MNNEGGSLVASYSDIFAMTTSINTPSIGVQDGGAMRFASGVNSNVSGTSCWAGAMFSETDGVSSSNTMNNFENTDNKSNWTCQ